MSRRVNYGPAGQGRRLLLSKVRSAIVAFLHRRPAASITDLCRENQLSWGSAQHHLYLLEQAGLVESVRVGRTVALFPAEPRGPAPQVLALLHAAIPRALARAILDQPGLQQKELCLRLGLTRKVFRHHMDQLVAAGLVVEHAAPKRCTYEPAPLLRAQANPRGLPKPADGLPRF